MPYCEEEYRQLEQLFFQCKKLNRMVCRYLKEQGEPETRVEEASFRAFIAAQLRDAVQDEDWRNLLLEERVEDDPAAITRIHGELTRALAGGGGQSQSPMCAVPASPAQPAVPAGVRPPNPLTQFPGYPLSPEYAVQVCEDMGLSHQEAKEVLKPVRVRGSMIQAEGYPYPLYHETISNRSGLGVKNRGGSRSLTRFYACKGGEPYLVALGSHSKEKPNSYRVFCLAPANEAQVLRGQLLTFDSQAPIPPEPRRDTRTAERPPKKKPKKGG